MIIEKIELLNKGKRRIWLDNGTFFSLYSKEARSYELEPEAWLSKEQYQSILEEILIPRAKRRAMHLLERMDRTEAQLREKLKANEYPPEAIDEAVEYVKGYRYIDDLRYACSYIRYRSHSHSRRQLTAALYQRGVSRELVSQALEEEYKEEDESPKILKWMEKKHYDAKEADTKQKQRMYQFLMRKGFRSEDILRML